MFLFEIAFPPFSVSCHLVALVGTHVCKNFSLYINSFWHGQEDSRKLPLQAIDLNVNKYTHTNEIVFWKLHHSTGYLDMDEVLHPVFRS